MPSVRTNGAAVYRSVQLSDRRSILRPRVVAESDKQSRPLRFGRFAAGVHKELHLGDRPHSAQVSLSAAVSGSGTLEDLSLAVRPPVAVSVRARRPRARARTPCYRNGRRSRARSAGRVLNSAGWLCRISSMTTDRLFSSAIET